jgi:hypothetical protein
MKATTWSDILTGFFNKDSLNLGCCWIMVSGILFGWGFVNLSPSLDVTDCQGSSYDTDFILMLLLWTMLPFLL